MIDVISVIAVDSRLCGQCGGCVAICAPDAIFLSPNRLEIDAEICTLCGDCIAFCPIGALSLG